MDVQGNAWTCIWNGKDQRSTRSAVHVVITVGREAGGHFVNSFQEKLSFKFFGTKHPSGSKRRTWQGSSMRPVFILQSVIDENDVMVVVDTLIEKEKGTFLPSERNKMCP